MISEVSHSKRHVRGMFMVAPITITLTHGSPNPSPMSTYIHLCPSRDSSAYASFDLGDRWLRDRARHPSQSTEILVAISTGTR